MFPVMLTLGMGDKEIAILRIIDWDSLEILAETQYRSELSCFQERQKNSPHPLPMCKFNGSSFFGDLLLTCTHNEVVIYTFDKGFKFVRALSRPTFTDLHHVHYDGDRLLVVNTGLDIIEEIDLKGNLIKQYLMADDVHQRYDLSKDYRRIASTKPHTSHPNWITPFNGRYLVTMLQTRSVVDLETRETVIEGFPHKVHDGIPYANSLYYTTTDGRIIRVDQDDMQIKAVHPTAPLFGKVHAGWCRGLCVRDENRLLAGYTRFRKTNSPGFKASFWQKSSTLVKDVVKYALGRPAPSLYRRMNSHIAEIDIGTNRLIKDYSLESPVMRIYGIYPLNDVWSQLVLGKNAK